MRKLAGFLFFIVSFSSFAATVKITSFVYVRNDRTLAELCGVVEDATTSPSFVRLVVDHRGSRPGVYNTLAGVDGKFCHAVITYRGEAQASIMGEDALATASTK